MNVQEKPAEAPAPEATAELDLNGMHSSLQVRQGTLGPDVIDVTRLYRDTGCFTYDPGFTSTANCVSRITYIDGDKGVLLYRGYPIDQLAEQSSFLETCYLLLYGELPTKEQFDSYRATITRHTMVHEQMTRFFTGFRRDAHPMAVMVGVVGALSAFYHDSTDINDPVQRAIASHRMIAKMPTIAAMAYKYSIGQPFIYPRNDLDFTANFLQMCFAIPCEPYLVNPVLHEGARPHLHPARRPRAERLDLDGAARRLVGRQPVRLHRRRHRLPVGARARRRQRGRPQHAGGDRHGRPHPRVHQAGEGQELRLPPHGLRPSRLQELRPARQGHAEDLPRGARRAWARTDEPLLKVAMELERIALQDDYFIEKKLYPNIDFYSGITLRALGFPVSMFTVLFAIARTVGWIAQWKEMIEDPEQRIGRPRQLYIGPAERDFVPIDQRG